jgi:O-glycosyl hydrolase
VSNISKIEFVMFQRIITKQAFIILTVFSLQFFAGITIHAQTTSINVDLNRTYQTIDNFSASDCWWAHVIGNEWNTANKDSVADLLFSTTKGIGLSAWRFNLGAGIDGSISDSWRTAETFEVSPGNYDWSRDAGGQWFLKAAKERGIDQFIAFVNSPPRSMTRNGHSYCTDGLGSTNLKDGYYSRFSKYLVDILKHFRDSVGINFNFISPVNEPQWEWSDTKQEGNRASNDDIKKIVDSLYAELNYQDVATEIIIPESGNLPDWYTAESSISSKYGKIFGNYLYSLFNDANVSVKAAKIFAGHSYWSDLLSSEIVQARQALFSRMGQFFPSGYKYWVTEYCILEGTNGQGGNGRDLSMTTALDVARIINFDLTIANASAWQWWLATSKYDYKDGLIYTNYGVNGTYQSIIRSKTLWVLGNYSRFIRPASQRIDCSGVNDKYGLMASAYLDSSETKIILVFVNVGTGDKPINFNFSGLDSLQTIKYLTPYITRDNPDDDLKAYPAIPVDSGYIIPAKSVVTMVGMLDGSAITEVTKRTEKMPQTFQLNQNYPNPFNPSSIISYKFPENSLITLNIYDMLGNEIKKLVKDRMR